MFQYGKKGKTVGHQGVCKQWARHVPFRQANSLTTPTLSISVFVLVQGRIARELNLSSRLVVLGKGAFSLLIILEQRSVVHVEIG